MSPEGHTRTSSAPPAWPLRPRSCFCSGVMGPEEQSCPPEEDQAAGCGSGCELPARQTDLLNQRPGDE